MTQEVKEAIWRAVELAIVDGATYPDLRSEVQRAWLEQKQVLTDRVLEVLKVVEGHHEDAR